MLEYHIIFSKTYDYIIQIRPDILLYHNILNCIKSLDIISVRQVYFIWNFCLIGRYEAMKYYCKFFDKAFEKERGTYIFNYCGLMSSEKYYSSAFAINVPEIQLCKLFMEYFTNNNMIIDEAMKDSHINAGLSNRGFTHHGNNNLSLNYYDEQEDYKLIT